MAEAMLMEHDTTKPVDPNCKVPAGALYIVPTPIGNLDDITLRAIKVLQAATLIAAEDTRHSRILLDKLGIGKVRMISCHDHNEDERVDLIATEVEAGGIAALISDAGTPLISDPGYKLAAKLAARKVKIYALPGPCAAITALCSSALPTDQFLFSGFLPVKDKELTEKLESIKLSSVTTVFYESPRRILNTLSKIKDLDPKRPLALCREMTKTFETIYRLPAQELFLYLSEHPEEVRGEFVLVVGPHLEDKSEQDQISEAAKRALTELLPFTKAKLACRVISDLTGENKKRLYDYALSLKQED